MSFSLLLKGNYIASILAVLVVQNVVSLSLFNCIPEDSMFSMSYRAGDFIAQIVAAIVILGGDAKTIFEQSKVSIKSLIIPQDEAVKGLDELMSKYNLPFLI